MTVKELLANTRHLNRYIITLQRERELYQSLVAGLTASPQSETVTECKANIAKVDADITAQISEAQHDIDLVHSMISGLSKPIYKELLTQYYILGYTWDSVANNLGYSVPHIFRLHRDGITELEKIDRDSQNDV